MGLRELARSALLLLLVPLAACASAQGGTAIDVVVSEAEPLSAELTEIELIVEELGGDVARRVRHERVPARYDAGRLLPWSQRVLPATSARAGVLHRFRARGFRADLPVVDVQGRMAFVTGQRLVLPLRFYRSCEGVDCSAFGDRTCRAGRCEDDFVDPCALLPSGGCDGGAGSGHDATGLDAAAPPAAACTTDAACDDGLACTVDRCDVGRGTCISTPSPDGATCGAGRVCCASACVDPRTDATHCGGCGRTCSGATPACLSGTCGRCASDADCGSDALSCTTQRCSSGACIVEVAGGSCLVDGSCHVAGTTRPGDPCLVCAPERSSTSWSVDVGGRCDDGLYCTRDDACTPTGLCVGDDVRCPSGTTCDEASDSCACAPDREVCNGRDDDCNGRIDDVPGGCTTMVCTPGSTRSVGACGSCGTLTESCGGDGNWSGATSCEGEGECSAGETGTLPGSCGRCGRRERDCSSGCRWGSERCVDEGGCTPGEVRWGASCGRCGAYQQTCSPSCQWVEDTGTCYGEGACFPGEVRASGACDPCEEEVCNDVCAWSGACQLRAGAECPWWGGSNWRCCGPSAWQFCLPDVCVWSTDCVDCSAGGCGC